MTLKQLLPDARLALSASFVPRGGVICDVGTDHAYLPIALLRGGICTHAVACDINEAPLQSARLHAAAAGCDSRISFYLADGLRNIDLAAEGVTHIVICGMGGELIGRILTESEYARRADVQAIVQPMSSREDLRAILSRAGFQIEDERLARANGRIYTCMTVRYSGEEISLTPAELVLGAAHIRRGSEEPLFAEYLREEIFRAEKKYRGRLAGQLSAEAEKALLDELYGVAEKEGVSL